MPFPKGDPGVLLAKVLRPGDVCVDGGANTGELTRIMAKAVGPDGLVIAVEPDPRCQVELQKVEREYPQVRIVEGALCATTSRTTFYQAQNAQQSSRFQGAVRDRLAPKELLDVRAETLDRLCKGPIRAVKLDLQGGEVDALTGAWGLLRRCDHWIVEIWPEGLAQAGASVRRLLTLCEAAGLRAHWMHDPPTEITEAEWTDWVDHAKAPHQFVNLYFTR